MNEENYERFTSGDRSAWTELAKSNECLFSLMMIGKLDYYNLTNLVRCTFDVIISSMALYLTFPPHQICMHQSS